MPYYTTSILSPFHRLVEAKEGATDKAALLARYSAALSSLRPAAQTARVAESQPLLLPLYDDGLLIRVPVEAFGETLHFMVDTGCTLSLLDQKYADRLAAPINRYLATTPISAGGNLTTYWCPQITLAGQELGLKEIGITDLRMARWVSGQPCDGILGMDFFARAVVSMDFDNKIFSVGGSPPSASPRVTALPLHPLSPHWTGRAQLNGSHALDLLIDTGDSSSLSLNAADWDTVFSGGQGRVSTQTIGSLTGQIAEDKIGHVQSLSVAGLNYSNLHASSLPNPASASTLGLNFFRRHEVTFAFQEGMIYLKPGRAWPEPDKRDLSGLHLLRIDGMTIVHSVDNGSPAAEAGIWPRDIIMGVNHHEAADLAMNEIRSVLRSRAGDRVSLQVRRGGGQRTAEFALKSAF